MAKEFVKQLYLDNNGLHDDELSLILHGLTKQFPFKTLIIQNNDIGKKCVDELHTFLNRKPPTMLEELHLINIKSNFVATLELCKYLRRNYLRKLSLVDVGLNTESILILSQVVKSSKTLISLDISWNTLKPRQMKPMIEVLSTNRKLHNLNLAWNNVSDNNSSEEDQMIIIKQIGKLIKHSRVLLHVDLTSTGLSEIQIKEIGASLRHARSLLNIHLSGNQNIVHNQEVKDWFVDKIKCRPYEEIDRF